MGAAVAGVASFLVWSYLRRFEDDASGGAKVQVLTVVRSIEPGGVLTDADIGERGIPQAYVDSRAIRSADRHRIANLRVSTVLDAQQILNWSDIASVNDERIMSTIVQDGMRAVTIHTEGRGSALVHPGDRVDVIATMPEQGNVDHRDGVTLFQNVLVLGRGGGASAQSSTSSTTGAGGCEGMDTALSLSPQHAALLAVASDKAKLSLSVRAPIDVKTNDLQQVTSKQITEPPKKAVVVAKPAGPQPVH